MSPAENARHNILSLDSRLICLTDSGPSVQRLKRMPSAIYCPLIYSQIQSMDLRLSMTSYGRIFSRLPTYQKKIFKKWGNEFIRCLGVFFFFGVVGKAGVEWGDLRHAGILRYKF